MKPIRATMETWQKVQARNHDKVIGHIIKHSIRVAKARSGKRLPTTTLTIWWPDVIAPKVKQELEEVNV